MTERIGKSTDVILLVIIKWYDLHIFTKFLGTKFFRM